MLKRAKSRSDPALCFAQFLSYQDCGSATHETIEKTIIKNTIVFLRVFAYNFWKMIVSFQLEHPQ